MRCAGASSFTIVPLDDGKQLKINFVKHAEIGGVGRIKQMEERDAGLGLCECWQWEEGLFKSPGKSWPCLIHSWFFLFRYFWRNQEQTQADGCVISLRMCTG